MTSSAPDAVDLWPALTPLGLAAASVHLPTDERPTVFVVEDDVNIREVLCLLLESEGMRVEAYAEARSFLETYDPDRPGCMLLDVSMPGMSGIELQQRLASQSISPAIIFVTGKGDIPMALDAMRSGAVDFIQKPFRAEVLITRIAEAIARDRENRRSHAFSAELERRQGLLTAREREVMELINAGQSTKAIASRLGISPKTVDKHRAKVLEKMQVDNPIELTHLLLGRSPH